MYTVNNSFKRVFFGIPFFSVFLISVFVFENTSAQNVSKYYVSSTIPNGTLYFIRPQSGFSNGAERLTFDVTYLTTNDSATINFSFFSKKLLSPDSLIFNQNGFRCASATNKIFVDSKKSFWHYRYTSKLKFSDLQTMFANAEHLPVWTISAKSEKIKLSISKRKWSKFSSVFTRIFYIIKMNN